MNCVIKNDEDEERLKMSETQKRLESPAFYEGALSALKKEVCRLELAMGVGHGASLFNCRIKQMEMMLRDYRELHGQNFGKASDEH